MKQPGHARHIWSAQTLQRVSTRIAYQAASEQSAAAAQSGRSVRAHRLCAQQQDTVGQAHGQAAAAALGALQQHRAAQPHLRAP